ncbi:MAG TPA: response regulator [Chloroflexota bacterium]|nr:response regulator [Chloroflexota bacterium]
MVSERSHPGLIDDGFVELVRDALLHLYDEAHLQSHPLAAEHEPGRPGAGRSSALRRALLDAIEALHPLPGVTPSSRAWRAYRILELRYIDGRDTASVMAAVALSKAQYHREHGRALHAVASLLRERWDRAAESQGLTRREAERLVHGEDKPVDLPEVLAGVCELLRPLASQRAVELRIAAAGPMPPVRGDRIGLRQALMAILAHAIRSAGAAAVDVAVSHRGHRLELLVTGRAAGPLAVLEEGVEEGRAFVEALRGELAWEPPAGPGAGWAIRLHLPAADRPVLLVVDNNADFARLVERYLTGHGWQVAAVPDLEHVAELAAQRRPRAILLDIVMPGRDGWDVLLELKASPATRDIPVLVCSVLDEPEVATSLGAAAYLRKPVDQPQLIAALGALG